MIYPLLPYITLDILRTAVRERSREIGNTNESIHLAATYLGVESGECNKHHTVYIESEVCPICNQIGQTSSVTYISDGIDNNNFNQIISLK